jgi:hypothetical protein
VFLESEWGIEFIPVIVISLVPARSRITVPTALKNETDL